MATYVQASTTPKQRLMNHEHEAHLSGYRYYLPYLPLLACPPMHLFTHARARRKRRLPASRKGNQGE